jgi:lipopolysaccharide biosynthesis glycosyltransferase
MKFYLHYIRKHSCKPELLWYSGSGEENILNDPTLFLHFCDYTPFEEDLALYLNNLEFLLPKDNLYQV